MAGGNAEIRERLTRLEEMLGMAADDAEHGSLTERVASQAAEIVVLMNRLASQEAETEAVRAALEADIELLRESHEKVRADVGLLRKAAGTAVGSDRSKFKLPEPKAFKGARSAKELENFLWDIEHYFSAARVPDAEKVTIATMYLEGDAKLWWRTRSTEDATAGRPSIDTWDKLKREIKDQFLPGNASWLARDGLRRLRHTGSVRDYVVQFSSLMLDVQDMTEVDKLYHFLSGLQPWAQAELRRQRVQDLHGALAAADALMDFRPSGEISASPSSKFKRGKGKNGDGKDSENAGNGGNGKQPVVASQSVTTAKHKGCFLCDGPHRARDCPMREKLNALLVQEDQEDSNRDENPMTRDLPLLNTLVCVTPPRKKKESWADIVEKEDKSRLASTRTSSSSGVGGLSHP